MKTETKILRAATEVALEALINPLLEEQWVLTIGAKLVLDSTDTEIWYATVTRPLAA